MLRIQVNPAHMMLIPGKQFLEDVYIFGFVALYVDRKNLEVLNLCSPSGHVLIFHVAEHGILLPKELETLLFGSPDVKKIALNKADINNFRLANGIGNIDFIDIGSVIEKNIPEIDNGILNFLTADLGETFSFDKFNPTEMAHLITNAACARAVAYGMWYVAF